MTMVDQELARRLVAAITGDLLGARAGEPRPQLRIVGKIEPQRRLDPVTRESHVKMIGHLRRRYGLQVLVDQAVFGKGSVDQLDDDELVALHRDLERARECMADGISLEDAGLLRSRYG